MAVTAPGIHLIGYDPHAARIPVTGRPAADKIRHGDWKCLFCRQLASFITRYGLDHAGDCPGAPR